MRVSKWPTRVVDDSAIEKGNALVGSSLELKNPLLRLLDNSTQMLKVFLY